MKTVTYEEYLKKVEESSYFKNRWDYFSVVIDEAKKINPRSVLEIGSYGFPLFPECVTFDVNKKWNPTVVQDAGNTPWPFSDKQFDLFISLQTWEHILKNKQRDAFLEVKRVAKKAILSFPYKWTHVSKNNIHYDLNETHFAEWTNNEPHRTILVGKKIIYIFDVL